MDKEIYKIISEVWKYLKKYLPMVGSNKESDWDEINAEIRNILALSDGKSESFKNFTFKVCDAANGLLYDLHFAEGRQK